METTIWDLGFRGNGKETEGSEMGDIGDYYQESIPSFLAFQRPVLPRRELRLGRCWKAALGLDRTISWGLGFRV